MEDFLRGYGFDTLVAEELTLREQVAQFTNAELVVSTHGAGFTNTLFSPPGTRIVDMIEPEKLSHAYVFWTMAEALGHEYWYFLADAVAHPGRQYDTHVPIDKLAATFERMKLERVPAR